MGALENLLIRYAIKNKEMCRKYITGVPNWEKLSNEELIDRILDFKHVEDLNPQESETKLKVINDGKIKGSGEEHDRSGCQRNRPDRCTVQQRRVWAAAQGGRVSRWQF